MCLHWIDKVQTNLEFDASNTLKKVGTEACLPLCYISLPSNETFLFFGELITLNVSVLQEDLSPILLDIRLLLSNSPWLSSSDSPLRDVPYIYNTFIMPYIYDSRQS